MRKKLSWYVVAVLILGMVLMTVSCGGQATEEETVPTVEEEEEEGDGVPTGSIMLIPHTLEGRDDCLMCHSSGELAVPADHAGRGNDTCITCHQPAK